MFIHISPSPIVLGFAFGKKAFFQPILTFLPPPLRITIFQPNLTYLPPPLRITIFQTQKMVKKNRQTTISVHNRYKVPI